MCKRKHKNPVSLSQQVQKGAEGKAPIFVQGSECSHRYEYQEAVAHDEAEIVSGRQLVGQGMYKCAFCGDERVFSTSHSRTSFRRPIKIERKDDDKKKKNKIPEPKLLNKTRANELEKVEDEKNPSTASITYLRSIIEKKKADALRNLPKSA